ncbi:hypothetical protein RFI_17820 [Reticulomyxa filosa]|uniref:Uncharacterized protein n=1 Tax=Reticulomyxa filosa TaxID=46433 RepID=X6N0L1_RETFI|nr:hypothetical protein RFI_17820 [Reticulomyxa filosa]|eukprot:ETO19408.1 hypothetical protein RFI_17820 [Reticulomyxa filosa]
MEEVGTPSSTLPTPYLVPSKRKKNLTDPHLHRDVSDTDKLKYANERLAVLNSEIVLYTKKMEMSEDTNMKEKYQQLIAENKTKVKILETGKRITENARDHKKLYDKETFKF